MPHIIVEATPRLGSSLDFEALFSAIHLRISESGHAELNDFKSRVHVTAYHLAGEDAEGEFIVARLGDDEPEAEVDATGNGASHPRHAAHSHRERQRPYWWQCCVLIETFDKRDYLKTDSRALEAQRTLNQPMGESTC